VEAVLGTYAKWRAIGDGPWNCENRRAIVKVMKRNLANGLHGRIEETIGDGGRIVSFRPEQPFPGGRPLDDGVAYAVVRMRDGLIVEMTGCADRAGAIAYTQTDQVPRR
jgi:hypothetical protein